MLLGLVLLGVSVPPPPALPVLAPELTPEALPPDSLGMAALPLLDEPTPEALPVELLLPELPAPELPPVMPAHATISIAQANDMNHLVIDHSR